MCLIRLLFILNVLDQKQQAAKWATVLTSVLARFKSQTAQVKGGLWYSAQLRLIVSLTALCRRTGTAKHWSEPNMKKGGILRNVLPRMSPIFKCCGGGVLLSHTLPGAVPLPCWVLASGFGMGPGVSPRP